MLNAPDPLPRTPACAELYSGPAGPFTAAAKSHGLAVHFAYEPDADAREEYAARHPDIPLLESIPTGQRMAALPKLNFLFGRLTPDTDDFDKATLLFLRINRLWGAAFLSDPGQGFERAAVHASKRMEGLGLNVSREIVAGRGLVVGIFAGEPFSWAPVEDTAENADALAQAVVGELMGLAG